MDSCQSSTDKGVNVIHNIDELRKKLNELEVSGTDTSKSSNVLLQSDEQPSGKSLKFSTQGIEPMILDEEHSPNVLPVTSNQKNVKSDSKFDRFKVRIQKGDFHQGDLRFSANSRGNQCTAIACVAICYFNDKSLFFLQNECTTDDINKIVTIGNNYYISSMNALKRIAPQNALTYSHLNLDEVFRYVQIDWKMYEISQKYLDGYIDYKYIEQGSFISFGLLLRALTTFFDEHDNNNGVFTCNGYSFAIFKKTDSDYFIFDSHERNANGFPTSLQGNPNERGTAVLCQMHSIECLTYRLLICCELSAEDDVSNQTLLRIDFSIIAIKVQLKKFVTQEKEVENTGERLSQPIDENAHRKSNQPNVLPITILSQKNFSIRSKHHTARFFEKVTFGMSVNIQILPKCRIFYRKPNGAMSYIKNTMKMPKFHFMCKFRKKSDISDRFVYSLTFQISLSEKYSLSTKITLR